MIDRIPFELTIIIIFLIENALLAGLTLTRFFKTKDYLPVLGRWGRSFTYMTLVSLFNLMYIVVRSFVDLPEDLTQPSFIMEFHFIIVISIRIFEVFAVTEFFKTCTLMRNTMLYKKRFLTKRQDSFLDVWVNSAAVFAFAFLVGEYTNFYQVGSPLMEAQVIGYKGMDIYVNSLMMVLFFIQFIILPKREGPEFKIYEQLRTIVLGNAGQKAIQTINIVFFDYTNYTLMLIEWIPSVIGIGWILYFFGKNYFFNSISIKKDLT